MISLNEVLHIHQTLIDRFGGTAGIRSKELLESAIARPFATFEGKDLYPTAVEKSAAIIESIVTNHPFIDGNKRTGYTLMRLLLLNANLDINASEDDKYKFVIQISEGKLDFDKIRGWIEIRIER